MQKKYNHLEIAAPDKEKVNAALRTITSTLTPYLMVCTEHQHADGATLAFENNYVEMLSVEESTSTGDANQSNNLSHVKQLVGLEIDFSKELPTRFIIQTSHNQFSLTMSELAVERSDTNIAKIRSENSLISPSEKRVLVYIREGLTSKEIADKLHLSEHTVNTHRRNMLEKTGTQNSAELVHFAAVRDLI